MDYSQAPEQLEGIISTIIYRNDANGFTVMELECDEQLVIATVNAPLLGEGERVLLSGGWTVHKEYGQQFKAASCQLLPPENLEQLERFLGSGLIRGVGPSTASAIIEAFGDETAFILENDPHSLTQIPGIGHKTAEKIATSYAENMHMRAVITGLSGYGITVSQAMRIASEYGGDAVALVRENPYRLADDVFGIGFKTADSIAQNMGIEHDSPFRVAAALKYYMQWAGNEGHTCIPSNMLVSETTKGLRVDTEQVKTEAANLILSGELVLSEGEPEMVYLGAFFQAESESARRLCRLSLSEIVPLSEDIKQCIGLQEKQAGIQLADKQLDAVLSAAHDAAIVISGGPGTGKTTIVQFLISIFDRSGIAYSLCAPTGRAAKRMTEATGVPSRTIHRLLEYGQDDENGMPTFRRNENKPLEEQAIIIDEMSMVDIFLFMRLLRALKAGTRVIMIGDTNQLPSVGAGNVLHDVIASGKIKNVELNTIYRQGEGSAISSNAHAVNAGLMPVPADGEFEIVELDSADAIWRYIQNLDALNDIQIIAPMKKGGAGVNTLNDRLQELCNPPGAGKNECRNKSGVLRVGDKVMQIRNNYQIEWTRDNGLDTEEGLGIFNGEMGSISRIDPAMQEITVRFDDDRMAIYDFMDADELERSYAITVHKSQGSEFDAVAIPVLKGPPMLYTRNLLYTAITRAKKRVWLLGSRYAIQSMIRNDRTKKRYSRLKEALEDCFHAYTNTVQAE